MESLYCDYRDQNYHGYQYHHSGVKIFHLVTIPNLDTVSTCRYPADSALKSRNGLDHLCPPEFPPYEVCT